MNMLNTCDSIDEGENSISLQKACFYHHTKRKYFVVIRTDNWCPYVNQIVETGLFPHKEESFVTIEAEVMDYSNRSRFALEKEGVNELL